MPLFFLHLHDRAEVLTDEEGEEFPSLVEARMAAIISLREIMAQKILEGSDPDRPWFEIADGSGRVLLVVRHEQAISEDSPKRAVRTAE